MSQAPLRLAHWLTAPRSDDLPVAWQGDRLWTLGQLRRDVCWLAAQLQAAPQIRWAMCFDDSYRFTVALLASLHAGKIPVIPGHNRLSLLQEQADLFEGMLSDQPLIGNWSSIQLAGDAPHSGALADLPEVSEHAHVELFTSGSTGQPRPVLKTVTGLDREAQLLVEHFGNRLSDCHFIASVVPQHLYGLTFRIMLPLALGRPFHASMLYYAEQLAALDPARHYAFISSPAFLKRLDAKLASPPLRLLLSAGGLLPWSHAQQSREWLGITAEEIYGSTETGILAWRQRHQDAEPWTPFPGVSLLNEATGWRARSPLIPSQEGWPLDDRLQFVSPTHFHLQGRTGRVVKIEEKRISLTEVEQRLLSLEGIQEAAALPISRGGRQAIGALLVLDEATRQRWQQQGQARQELAWRRQLRTWLEPVAVPRYWRVVDAIPVNSMNKRVMMQLQEFFYETR